VVLPRKIVVFSTGKNLSFQENGVHKNQCLVSCCYITQSKCKGSIDFVLCKGSHIRRGLITITFLSLYFQNYCMKFIFSYISENFLANIQLCSNKLYTKHHTNLNVNEKQPIYIKCNRIRTRIPYTYCLSATCFDVSYIL
jgi:hypothetical protein